MYNYFTSIANGFYSMGSSKAKPHFAEAKSSKLRYQRYQMVPLKPTSDKKFEPKPEDLEADQGISSTYIDTFENKIYTKIRSRTLTVDPENIYYDNSHKPFLMLHDYEIPIVEGSIQKIIDKEKNIEKTQVRILPYRIMQNGQTSYNDIPGRANQKKEYYLNCLFSLLEKLNKDSKKWKAEKIYLHTRDSFIKQFSAKKRLDEMFLMTIAHATEHGRRVEEVNDTFDIKKDLIGLRKSKTVSGVTPFNPLAEADLMAEAIQKHIPRSNAGYPFAIRVSNKALVLIIPQALYQTHLPVQDPKMKENFKKLLKALNTAEAIETGMSPELQNWLGDVPKKEEIQKPLFKLCDPRQLERDPDQIDEKALPLLKEMYQAPSKVLEQLEATFPNKEERAHFAKMAQTWLGVYELTPPQLAENLQLVEGFQDRARDFWAIMLEDFPSLHQGLFNLMSPQKQYQAKAAAG